MASERARAATVVVAVLASMVALEGHALADPTPAEKETARGLMTDGRQKREQNDLPNALKSFEAAGALMHVPTTGLEVARTQVAMGQLVEGRDTLRRVLLLPARADDPVPFQEARAAAEKLDAELNERIPAIKMIVRAAPSPPALAVDGVRIPPEAAGVPFRLNPGRHEITARAGSANVVKLVDVHERELADVALDFGAASSGVAARDGDGGAESSASSPGGSRALTYVAFGVGGVGLATGVVTGLIAMGSKNAAQDNCVEGRCPPAAWNDVDRAQTFATVSTVAFIVGGVGVGVGIVSLLVGGKSDPAPSAQSRAHVEPFVGLSHVGLRGAF